MVSAGLSSFMGANAPEEQHHDVRGDEEDLRGTRRTVPRALHPAHRGARRPCRGAPRYFGRFNPAITCAMAWCPSFLSPSVTPV
jgi:hypothetical protein